MASKSRKFRVATEGATTDGRKIERVWIEQMAKNYNPKKYGARVNLEHVKGISPDSQFKRYGDVLALSAEQVEDNKLGLFAVIDPTDELIALNKARQKVYTSIEVNPEFSDTGEAYLVGLAITDDPASLGCEMLKFSATTSKNPLASRKLSPGNLFTEAIEFTLELEDDHIGAVEGFASKIKAMFSSNRKAVDSSFSELQQAIETIADSQQQVLKQAEGFSQLEDQHKTLQAEHKTLAADFAELKQQLSAQPAGFVRQPTAGGKDRIAADC